MMKKLANKLRGKTNGQKGKDQELRPAIKDDVDPKYLAVGPVPAPRPYDHDRDRAVQMARPDQQEDVGTFSGFGDWMATFKPDPVARDVVEVEAPLRPYVDELLTMPGNFREDLLMSLVLSGLRKPSNSAKFTVQIRGPWFMTLRSVNGLLTKYGYEEMVSARRTQGAASNWSGDDAVPTHFEIPVIDGGSLIDLDGPEPVLLIGRDEQVSVFYDKVRRLRARCKDGKVIATSFPAELEIGFNRTLRLPEDGKIHHQPARLGRIGVNSIASIAKKLEASRTGSLMDMARKGGVFFPLYQREALFLSFKARCDAFAVRVFAGGVNAVSGLAWNSDRRTQTHAQDYLSVPPQQYLDGVCVARDIVKQFVAMPLGSGYSVEKQVTGREDVGGMQIQIAPARGWVLEMLDHGFIRPILQSHLTPRMLNAELLILHKVRGFAHDEIEEEKRFSEETIPVYMRHLYQSQVVGPPDSYYGDAPHSTAFHAGLTVSMNAVYMLNITLSYMDGGIRRMTTAEWAPWWTLERCFSERRNADFKVGGDFIDGMELHYQGHALRKGVETLQQQNVQDQAVVIIEPRQVRYSQPHGYYPSGQYYDGSQQFAPAPGWDVQEQTPAPGWDVHQQPQQQEPSYQPYRPAAQAPIPYDYSTAHPGPQPPRYQASGPHSSSQPTQPYKEEPMTPSYTPSSPSWSSPPSMVDHQQSFSSPSTYAPSPPLSNSGPSHPYPGSAPQSYGSPPPMSSRPPPQMPSQPPPQMSPQLPPQPPRPPRQMLSQPPQQASASPPWQPGRFSAPPAAPSFNNIGYSSQAPSSPPSATVSPISDSSYYHSSPSVSAPPSMAPTFGSPPQRQSYAGPSATPPPAQPKPQEQVLPEMQIPQTGWAMGIAAGSRIRQPILQDPFGPLTWNRDLATILSVQILNSVAFEALTGMVAPPSSITPQIYLEHGLPFFASYAEGVATDGQTNLAGLKSVGEIDAMDRSLQLNVDASANKAGCTTCGVMLCDSILRPCNHAFCFTCISKYMTFGQNVFCRMCNTKASRLVGFSAPMALPGEDRIDLNKAEIITLDPPKGSVEFHSVELYAEEKIGSLAFELAG